IFRPSLKGRVVRDSSLEYFALTVSGTQPITYRQRLQSRDEGRLDAPGLTGEFDGLKPSEQFLEERAHFHLRQVLAQADMRAVTECDMSVVLAVDTECERVVERLLVAVAGGIEHLQRLTLFDLPSAQVVILHRRAEEMLHRRHPADHLVD